MAGKHAVQLGEYFRLSNFWDVVKLLGSITFVILFVFMAISTPLEDHDPRGTAAPQIEEREYRRMQTTHCFQASEDFASCLRAVADIHD